MRFWVISAVFFTLNTFAADKILIGFSQANFAEPWRQAMNADILAAAKAYPDVEVKIADAAQDNAKQVADVESFIRQRVDVLMISPNEAQPLTPAVRKAYNAGIPVVVLDRKIVGDSFTSFVGADNKIIGRAAGRFAAALLKGQGTLVEIKGLSGSTPASERSQGFHEIIDQIKGIKVVHAATADWLRDKARAQMEMALQAHEKIDLVYAHNDPMAMGAYLAAKAAGREKQIKFIGIDALPGPDGGVKMVLDGKLAATFVYPTGGKQALEIAVKSAHKISVPKLVTLDTKSITAENARQQYTQ